MVSATKKIWLLLLGGGFLCGSVDGFSLLVTRRGLIVGATTVADIGDIFDAARRNNEITYSQNGKNIKRMQNGDYSMGSRQTSTSPSGFKRRAAGACKSSRALRASPYASEAECTRDVLDGNVDGILEALASIPDCKVDATHVCL